MLCRCLLAFRPRPAPGDVDVYRHVKLDGLFHFLTDQLGITLDVLLRHLEDQLVVYLDEHFC